MKKFELLTLNVKYNNVPQISTNLLSSVYIV